MTVYVFMLIEIVGSEREKLFPLSRYISSHFRLQIKLALHCCIKGVERNEKRKRKRRQFVSSFSRRNLFCMHYHLIVLKASSHVYTIYMKCARPRRRRWRRRESEREGESKKEGEMRKRNNKRLRNKHKLPVECASQSECRSREKN